MRRPSGVHTGFVALPGSVVSRVRVSAGCRRSRRRMCRCESRRRGGRRPARAAGSSNSPAYCATPSSCRRDPSSPAACPRRSSIRTGRRGALAETANCAPPVIEFDRSPSIAGTGGPVISSRPRSNGAANSVPSWTYTRWPLRDRAVVAAPLHDGPRAIGQSLHHQVRVVVGAGDRAAAVQHRRSAGRTWGHPSTASPSAARQRVRRRLRPTAPQQARALDLRGREDNRVVLAPRAAARGRRIGQRDRRAAGHGNLLQGAGREETDPLPIGEKNSAVASSVPDTGTACS